MQFIDNKQIQYRKAIVPLPIANLPNLILCSGLIFIDYVSLIEIWKYINFIFLHLIASLKSCLVYAIYN